MKMPVPSPRTLAVLAWATGLGALVLVLWLLVELSQTNARFEVGAADRRDLRAQLITQQSAASALADQLVDLGEEPVVDPVDPPPAAVTLLQGERGPAGARGPAGLPGLPGLPGDPGADGEPGASGAAGADGEPGAAGESGATGPQGEAGTTGAQGPAGAAGPQGEPGPQGPAGAPGSDGRGVTSVACTGVPDSTTWTFTYTDGTTQTVTCTPTSPGPTDGPTDGPSTEPPASES